MASAQNPWPKIVVHADMDAFYAAVEQLDNPELRGKPVLVGPNSHRGVVLTASYEARPYKVGSAMPVVKARRLCPDAIMVPPRFERYAEISKQVMEVFSEFSPRVEPLSLDEAFLEMTGAEHIFGTPTQMGRKIKQAVFDTTGLNISVGVSGTKYVAKVASAHDKPNGLTVVPPNDAVQWLAPMSIRRLWGVGEKTSEKLHALGFHTIGDIACVDEHELRHRLGASGAHFHRLANGLDPRRVSRGRTSKSIGSERTLNQDVSSREDIERYLRRSADRIARRVRAKQLLAAGVRVRLKTTEFKLLTRQTKLVRPDDRSDAFFAAACQLLGEFEHPGPFRLVGMAAFDLHERNRAEQTDLFESNRSKNLDDALDKVISRFGKGVVVRARDLTGSGTVADTEVNLDFLDYFNDDD